MTYDLNITFDDNLITGNKTIDTQRIMQMPAASSYRVALMLEKDCPIVHLSLRAIGDDGTKETITIKGYKIGKKKVMLNSNALTLSDIKGNTLYEIFLFLEYSDKMRLELLIY